MQLLERIICLTKIKFSNNKLVCNLGISIRLTLKRIEILIMRSCFVPNCDQKWKWKEKKRPMFFAPRDEKMFAKWAAVLHNTRPFKQTNRICYRHFQEKDIERYFQHTINGKVYQLERERWLLKPFAVPTLNLLTENDVRNLRLLPRRSKHSSQDDLNQVNNHEVVNSKLLKTQSKSIADSREATETNVNMTLQIQEDVTINLSKYSSCDNRDILEDVAIPVDSHQIELFNDIYDEIFDVELPNTLWGVHRCPNRTVIMLTLMNPSKLTATKILKIDCNGSIEIIVAAHIIRALHMINDKITSTGAISHLLTDLDEIKICHGSDCSETCDIFIHKEDDNKFCKTCLKAKLNIS